MLVRLITAYLLSIAIVAPAHCEEGLDVLFIAVDDLNDWVDILSGHPQTSTPNIDRLAARGLSFLNAHAPSTLCNPSRTAFLSGLRPSTTGIYGNTPDWRTVELFKGIRTLPRFFRDNGYRTLGTGKIFHAHTFSESGLSGYNDTTAWDAFYPSLNRQLPNEVIPLTRPENKNPVMVGFDWATVVTEDSAMGDGQTVSWATRQLLAETGSPRFTAVGIYRPHLPWYLPQKYFDMHPLDQIKLPNVASDDLDDIPIVAQSAGTTPRKLHEWVLESGKWKDAIRAYLASVSFADAMVGRLLDALDQSGRADRTIIVLLGDHGFHLGEKERWNKSTLWEESTRVPLIFVAPGVTTAGSHSTRPVSLMDVYPTLVELAGLAIPSHVEGRSLVPLLEDPQAEWPYPALTTFGSNNHAVRSERYRYIRYADGTEELYDHLTDENEWTNLAADPKYAALMEDLAQWMPEENAADLAKAD